MMFLPGTRRPYGRFIFCRSRFTPRRRAFRRRSLLLLVAGIFLILACSLVFPAESPPCVQGTGDLAMIVILFFSCAAAFLAGLAWARAPR